MKQKCKPLSRCRWSASIQKLSKTKDLSRTEQRNVSGTAIKARPPR